MLILLIEQVNDMNDLVKVINGQAMVSSKDIADKFGKVHRKVIIDIEKLHCSDEFRKANFRTSSYTSLQNKVLPSYELTRDGFAFLCMGFTGKKAAKFKEAYISAFNAMELELSKTPATLDDLNKEVGLLEGAEKVASFHGKGLRTSGMLVKKKKEDVKEVLNQVQMTLEI